MPDERPGIGSKGKKKGKAAAAKKKKCKKEAKLVPQHMPGRNGKQTPPRPRIEIEAPSASPEEAAAIAAALERFLAETAPAPHSGQAQNPWQRAALAEGIASRQISPSGWGPAVGR